MAKEWWVSNKKTKDASSRRGEDWGRGEREGLGISESWTGVQIIINSVLDGFRERRLEDIHSAMLEKREPRLLPVDLKASEGEKDM
jgi:hypothetical protein